MISVMLTTPIIYTLSLIAGVFGIGLLIFIHELGHFLFCKLFGIDTPSFSIGFGPVLWKKKFGATEFTLCALPLGGYVEIAGSYEVGQGEQEHAHRVDEGALSVKPLWQKLCVILGGITFNLLFAFTVITLVWWRGAPPTPVLYPENTTTKIQTVVKDLPAQKAGVREGDTIIAINGTQTNNEAINYVSFMQNNAADTLTLSMMRDTTPVTVTVPLNKNTDGTPKNQLGISFVQTATPAISFGHALSKSFNTNYRICRDTLKSLASIATKRSTEGMGGPLLIISETTKSAQKGFASYFLFLALISLSLAVLNIIPLPILDGGQALIFILEALFRRQFSETVKTYIYYACWIGFFGLIIYLSLQDIVRIFQNPQGQNGWLMQQVTRYALWIALAAVAYIVYGIWKGQSEDNKKQ